MNNLGWSALLEAVILGNGGRLYSDIIQLLVDAGADVHLPDRDGKSSLQHAEELGQERVIRILNKEKLTIHPSIQSAQELARAEDFRKASLVMEHAMQVDSNNSDFYYYKGYFLGNSGDMTKLWQLINRHLLLIRMTLISISIPQMPTE